MSAAPAASAQALPITADIAIDGPPPPVPPGVMTRDGRGRVTIRAERLDRPLRVDGVLDDEPYTAVESIGDFIQQEPSEGEPSTEPTDVWVLFDRDHLYVSARCRDSQPDRIVANDMRREGRNVTQNDNMSIIIDTFYDRRNGYEFLVNPVGGMVDNQITDERDINRDWNAVWYAKTQRGPEGWTVEVAIPFRSLRYRSSGAQVWGINIRRTIRWKNEFVYLSPVPRQYGPRGILRLSSAATLVGLEVPAAARHLEVKPFALSGMRADRAVDPSFGSDFHRDAGIDVKYGFTRSLTADITYRTDFAQVEDDDQQVNLTRFSLFYPEKRDFFLEGQGIFAFGGVETGLPRTVRSLAASSNVPVLFFSRQIGLSGDRPVPIEAGGRVTGKAGQYSLGLLEIQTGDSAVARGTNFAVARVKRDILRRSYIGLLGTRRSPSVDANGAALTYGADASFSFFENLNLLGYYARTRTPGLTVEDDSYRARFDYDADLLGVQIERLSVGRHFAPEVGFLRRSDFIENLAQLRVSRRPRSPLIRKVNLEAGLDYLTDREQRLENRTARGAIRTELHSGDSWTVEYTRAFEAVPAPFPVAGIEIPTGVYRYSTVWGSYTLGSQRRIAGDIVVSHGGFYDGERTELGYRGRVELSARLSVEPGVTVNWLDLPVGPATAKLFSTRSTFSFSPTMWVGALVQYNSAASLATTNLRFRWEYRPGSDLFVVYSDGRDTFVRDVPGMLNRAFTIKITRLFRF